MIDLIIVYLVIGAQVGVAVACDIWDHDRDREAAFGFGAASLFLWPWIVAMAILEGSRR